ncbi:serine hydrolase domain-containing protein [Arenicella chitinivorans]|nr:serine hydrolase [Arenicella chitinivorans]
MKNKLLMLVVSFLCCTAQDLVWAEPSVDPVSLPQDKSILFWSTAQRSLAFRIMEKIAPHRVVKRSARVSKLTDGAPLTILSDDGKPFDLDRYMQDQQTAGVIALHKGKIRLERYGLGFDSEQRWTSFSVAKSFTSTLVGAALQDGAIESLDTPITRYIPELKDSGYDGVTVEQLLTMRSGVQWNEDYSDPNSDVVKFGQQKPMDGIDPVISYMQTKQRDAEPGSRWQYNTGETNLIGVLVAKATGKTLADYLSEKIWRPLNMESDAIWVLNAGGFEIAGCCLSARLRDYARLGVFALNGGQIDGKQIVPVGWFERAGSKQADIGRDGYGYGYQWWTYDDGSFAAQGIFGQGIFIDPNRDLVIATNGNWPVATGDALKIQRNAMYRAVQRTLDTELLDQ